MKKVIFIIIAIITILGSAFLLFAHYNGIIKVDKFDGEFFSCIVSNAIVIVLFVATFLLIDNRNITQDKNKKRIAKMLLERTYSQVKHELDFTFKSDLIIKTMIKKVDPNEPFYKNEVLNVIKSQPFTHHDDICSFAQEGIIDEKVCDNYITVREKYFAFVTNYIVLFDQEDVKKLEREEIEKALATAQEGLKNL